MPQATAFKQIVVEEDPKTSLREAGIYPLTLHNGAKIVVFGHLFIPYHDRLIFAKELEFLANYKPAVVILAGGIVSEQAFKALLEDENNFLHDDQEAPEVVAARRYRLFEDKVEALGKALGAIIRSIQAAAGPQCKMFYIPSATHLSMGNEHRVMKYIERKKKMLDGWVLSHPDAESMPSDPTRELSRKLATILQLEADPTIKGRRRFKPAPMIKVLRFGSAIFVNGKTLFMIGDFRRRKPGGAAKVEWDQRQVDIVRSFDGKVSGAWMTTANHTLPGLTLDYHEFHEVGYGWDPTQMGHFRDYDLRCPGFWVGEVEGGVVWGTPIYILRSQRPDDQRRSFVVDGVPYTEDEPGALPNGCELSLAPETA